ncbi:ABC transporter substrate-binding protein [Luteipulveratus halotolerans]|uniref:Iron transporter n=1 Tax=Luteipulveratus halotolerans TaxID=1631356 RepID=A0A0L6CGU7_9MICO|nr:ABC transporter substrate-binding protein [Luteipulveratus halotolerans]KNX36830.1 iron transporter [Luteipulveratus halotolerans]
MNRRLTATLAGASVLLLAACSSTDAGQAGRAAGARVTVSSCGEQTSFPKPAQRLFVNDGNLISMVLALKAQDRVAAVSSIGRDKALLRKHYGAAVDSLKVVAPEYPSLETVVAQRPDVMVAGWGYGYSEEKGVTPEALRAKGIDAFTLTESCRQHGSRARGTVDPWTALRTDLTHLGTITGHDADARRVNTDLDRRLAALRSAPKPKKPPTVFVFDSGDKEVFSSGALGAPQAVIAAGGGRNPLSDLKDTWTSVSWERVAASRPDAIFFVDYPPQSFAQKVHLLRTNPATRDLPAVRQGRFLNLPYAMWTSGPLNIDAAEQARVALERWDLVPRR